MYSWLTRPPSFTLIKNVKKIKRLVQLADEAAELHLVVVALQLGAQLAHLRVKELSKAGEEHKKTKK